MLLVSPGRAGDRRLIAALRPLIGAIPVERMRQANLMVDRDDDKRTPARGRALARSRVGAGAAMNAVDRRARTVSGEPIAEQDSAWSSIARSAGAEQRSR